MSSNIAIPTAEVRRIYSLDDVARAAAELEESQSPLLRKTYLKMAAAGDSRLLVKPSRQDALDRLYDDCPNFTEIIDDLRKYLALALYGDEPLSVMPILLLGDPGVGKTHFAKSLAAALQTECEFCSMATLSASWILSGSAATWRDARPGKVATRLIDGRYANPVIVLDELDKACSGNYDPVGPLYQLFERETATHFRDEFVDIEIDASNVVWICTANDASAIPEPILSRMAVYDVRSPTRDEAKRIGRSIYSGLLAEHRWRFAREITDEALDALSSVPPREMKKRLLDALGRARLAMRDFLRPDDFATAAPRLQRAMGFIG
jgi:ATP-dependent Lon protease